MENAEVLIRPAARHDLKSILEIYNDAVLNTTASADYEPQTMSQRIQWYESRKKMGFPMFVAEAPGRRVVGWASLSPYHTRPGYRFTAENSVYIAADWRGRGIGRHLMIRVIESAREIGLHAIVASIEATSEASIRLHASLGFEQRGHLRELIHKFDRWLDVVYMELVLDA
jgi:phosphinothricin acetyltransferase